MLFRIQYFQDMANWGDKLLRQPIRATERVNTADVI